MPLPIPVDEAVISATLPYKSLIYRYYIKKIYKKSNCIILILINYDLYFMIYMNQQHTLFFSVFFLKDEESIL